MVIRHIQHPTLSQFRAILRSSALAFCAMVFLSHCSSSTSGYRSNQATDCVVSVKEQKLAYYHNGQLTQTYAISTSKYGLSDKPGKYGTPPGLMEVVAKIGHGARAGTVFHGREATGEVIKPGTPGRDPIVSRIMWLRGMESQNRNAYERCIYIHGTADEAEIGRPVSYGCIRMKSLDVVDLFNRLPIGSRVFVTESALPATVALVAPTPQPPAVTHPPLMLNPEGAQIAATLQPARSQTSASAASASAYKVQMSADGSSVVYTAPSNSLSPNMVLKSTRSASSYQKDSAH